MKIPKRLGPAICIVLSGCLPMVPAPAGRQVEGTRRSLPVAITAPPPAAPVLKRLPKGRYYVRQPWTVDLNGERRVIPRGYTSNGITAPAAIKRNLGDGVDYPETWAAIFHDWLFTQPGVTRLQADKMFYDLLIAYGVPDRKAGLMFASVSAYSMSKKFR